MKKLIVILTLFPVSLFAQLDNSPFYVKDTLIGEKNDLFFKLKTLGFNRNDEYYTKFANGQTFFGYQFNPELEFYLTDKIALSGGVFVNKDFGNPQFTLVQPTYQIKIKHRSNLLLFGNINGNLNHKYIEPIYNFSSLMIRPKENGIQYLAMHKRWNADLWMDWQRNIYEGSGFLEQIYGGVSCEYILKDSSDSKIRLSFPLQFLVFHEGGQIDAVPDRLKLVSNGSLGLKLSWFPASGFLDEISTENHFCYFDDYMNDYSLKWQSGNGVYLNVSVRKKHQIVMLSYWQGNRFIGIRGAPVFNSESVSYKWNGTLQEKRRLLFLRLISNYKLSEDVSFSLRLEPYLDFGQPLKQTFSNGILDFSHALYFNVEKRFFVKTLNSEKTGK